MRKFMLLRLVFLVPLLAAVFVLHVSGTALVIVHVVRIAIVALGLLIAGVIRTRRTRDERHPES